MNINWTINVWDLVLLGVGGIVLYGRLVAIETKLAPIWNWWTESNDLAVRRRKSDIIPGDSGHGY